MHWLCFPGWPDHTSTYGSQEQVQCYGPTGPQARRDLLSHPIESISDMDGSWEMASPSFDPFDP